MRERDIAWIGFLLLVLLMAPFCAWAQAFQPQGAPVTTTQAGSTIAVTNTFQQVLAPVYPLGTPPVLRQGCLVQNNGSHTMYVFFGPIASATTAKSFQLTAGQGIGCATGSGAVLQDQVSITGTSGDAYGYSAQ